VRIGIFSLTEPVKSTKPSLIILVMNNKGIIKTVCLINHPISNILLQMNAMTKKNRKNTFVCHKEREFEDQRVRWLINSFRVFTLLIRTELIFLKLYCFLLMICLQVVRYHEPLVYQFLHHLVLHIRVHLFLLILQLL